MFTKVEKKEFYRRKRKIMNILSLSNAADGFQSRIKRVRKKFRDHKDSVPGILIGVILLFLILAEL